MPKVLGKSRVNNISKITFEWHLKYDCTKIILPSCIEILLNTWVFGPNSSLNVPFDNYLLWCRLLILFVHCVLWYWYIYRSYSLFCYHTYYQNHLSLIKIVVGCELLFLPIFIQWGDFIVVTHFVFFYLIKNGNREIFDVALQMF